MDGLPFESGSVRGIILLSVFLCHHHHRLVQEGHIQEFICLSNSPSLYASVKSSFVTVSVVISATQIK